MSNTSSIAQWLDHLTDLLPPKVIRLVGAGNGSGILAQWLAEHGQVPATLVEANSQLFAALQRQQAIGNWGQASLINTVIAPTAGEVDFFTASLTAESGILPAEELRAVWPNVYTVATERRAATDLAALLQVDGESSADQQWLLLDCLPAAPLLHSAQAQLQNVDVVVVRVLQAVDSIPTLSGIGGSLEDVTKALPGFRLLALQPSRHPALAHALFVRDHRSVAQQAQADLQVQLTKLQMEKAELLQQLELQAQAQQALQADFAQIAEARDTEAKARQVAQQAQAELQAQLEKLLVEKAELLQQQEQLRQSQQALQVDLHKIDQALDAREVSQLLPESVDALAQELKEKSTELSEKITKQNLELVKIRKQLEKKIKDETLNAVHQLEAFLNIQSFFKYGEYYPMMHGWPVSPDFALCLIDLLARNDYDLILEFGSGSSTVLMAKALERLHKGERRHKVVQVAFEHLERYYAQTLADLKSAGMDKAVDMVLAPLQPYTATDGTVYQYYACQEKLVELVNSEWRPNSKILVVVDGPPGSTGKHARYPAVPVILSNFKNCAIDILLDDYAREDEKEVGDLWIRDCEVKGLNMKANILNMEKGALFISISH